MGQAIIELEALTKTYEDVKAVNQLTLNIYEGEIFGLLGPNGSGKSTTILMMLGLTEPTSGSVNVCGINSTREPLAVKRRVGYLPDDVGFYDHMTGLENLLFTASLNAISRDEGIFRAKQLLKRVGLADAADKKAGTYSRGMRQRLGLADVLIKNPEIIILDEPTLGIDPEGVRDLLHLIRQLNREEKITVLLSSHHLHQVQQICDRVGLFVNGRLIAVGNTDELAAQLFEGEPVLVKAEVDDISPALIDKLSELPGAVRVEQNTDELSVYCQHDLTTQIAKTIIEHGASLRHISKKDYGLDDIYHRYFEGRETDEEA